MTDLTIHLSYYHMAAVGKEDMIRLFVKVLPGDFLFPLIKMPNLLFLFAFSDGFLMALQTD
jgi:hypothetical protein